MTEKKLWHQSIVFGAKLEIPEKTDLDKVCCASYYYAEDPECHCKCHGAFHDLGRLNKRDREKVEIFHNKPESRQTEDANQ